MLSYYKLNLKLNKFSRTDVVDLELDDIIIRDNKLQVVIDLDDFETVDLETVFNDIATIYKRSGVYIYPSEIEKYFETRDITKPHEEMIDMYWGVISCRTDCKKWYESIKNQMESIKELVKKIG